MTTTQPRPLPSDPFPSDLEIAQNTPLWPIERVAARAGIGEEFLEHYGRTVAKVDLRAIEALAGRPAAKYVLITAITPTPLGEGKTTTAVGLAQGLEKLGQRTVLALRQPSLGPVFGVKGGAAGGGYAQVLPMEKLNLHLTGDFHAVTAAHNLLAAMIDNHLHQGNALGLDPHRVSWRRVIDMNDRALRNVIVGLGGTEDGVPRQTGFDITAASEVMVILSLAVSLADLRARLGRIVVGYTAAGEPVTAEALGAAGAMAVLLKDALKPNLLQTTEHSPALIHAGPFGNIATGNSSVIADRLGARCADYLLTEAGFGADMGGERFFNVKCRVSGLRPAAAVLVVTVRALKAHSGRYKIVPGRPLPAELLAEHPDDVRAGGDNLRKHIEIVRGFGVSPVVAINAFPSDHPSEHAVIREIAEAAGARVAVSTHVAQGGAGAEALAREVMAACGEETDFRYTYDLADSIGTKLEKVARQVYGAGGIELSAAAKKQLRLFEKLGYGAFPVVIAKTHLSVSADPKLRGAPTGWTLPVRELRAAVGAGYVYAICGDMRTMPGLGARPSAEGIDLDERGEVVGLF
ncbi:Formate-tetrahydrofolate ligase [Deinococcus reticulitermitis]|uniref:Formate--tetrahydrofolate ligase n=1 Tax=Deinococcus reticulitermitis TaxID=856736 RepID=A0A1H6SSM2_9DEIO|nr:formate--tetrahydrofolate ligase [Deinococcus reticulitermitis]SEI70893.1 Formate-tetrahydrofolate ligase [Deinococcus reticulitermitis]